MNQGKPVGILSVTRTEPGAFADHHVQLLQTFADQAVIAIENTRLFNETQEALERQTATADILKVIAASPSDVQPVFEAIADSAKRLLGGFAAAVCALSTATVHLAAFTPTNPAADEALKASFPRRSRFDGIRGWCTMAEPVSSSRQRSRCTSRSVRELARLRGFRSMLFVPLMNEGVAGRHHRRHPRRTGPFADAPCRSCCRPSPTRP